MGKTKVTIQAGDKPPVEFESVAAFQEAARTVVANAVADAWERAGEDEPHCSDCFPVPLAATMRDFHADPQLEDLAEAVIDTFEELNWIAEHRIKVLWKSKGGKKLGKCVLASGLTGYFSNVDWVIWVAADHAGPKGYHLSRRQMEALLYHELKHCALEGEDEKPAIVDHDAEVFAGEIRHFGAWRLNLRRVAEAFKQMPLPEPGS